MQGGGWLRNGRLWPFLCPGGGGGTLKRCHHHFTNTPEKPKTIQIPCPFSPPRRALSLYPGLITPQGQILLPGTCKRRELRRGHKYLTSNPRPRPSRQRTPPNTTSRNTPTKLTFPLKIPLVSPPRPSPCMPARPPRHAPPMDTPEGRGQGVWPELRGEINHTHISQPDRNVQMAGTRRL